MAAGSVNDFRDVMNVRDRQTGLASASDHLCGTFHHAEGLAEAAFWRKQSFGCKKFDLTLC